MFPEANPRRPPISKRTIVFQKYKLKGYNQNEKMECSYWNKSLKLGTRYVSEESQYFWYYSDELEHDISTERLDLTFQGERHSVLGAEGFFYQPQEIVSLGVGDCVGIAREPWQNEQFSIVLQTLKKIIQITDNLCLSLLYRESNISCPIWITCIIILQYICPKMS